MDHENRLMTASGHANVNIALLKYWGKSDEKFKLPFQSSISLTLDELYTDTKLTLDPLLSSDQLFLNGQRAQKDDELQLQEYFNLVRQVYKLNGFIRVESVNHVPTAAGLASSASAYASIAMALNEIYGLNLDKQGVSTLARLGSGSAARSVFGGFTIWHKGNTHETSFAEKIKTDWDDLALIVVLISAEKKKVSSREAMKISVKLPSYNHFVRESKRMFPLMLEAIRQKSLSGLGELVEASSDLLHQTIRETGIDYYQAETYTLLDNLKAIKKDFPIYYTIDAGPNVKLLTSPKFVEDVCKRLNNYKVIVCRIGKDAYVKN